METTVIVETLGNFIDIIGVGVIGGGIIVSAVSFAFNFALYRNIEKAFPELRRNLARVILLGLELLVAADIVRSVAVSPSFTSVGVLAIIVIIRSFLSMELQLEVEGKWPWQK